MTPELESLLAKARAFPPMTVDERVVQSLNFAYGNLACTTHHKPRRAAFRALAVARMGWSEDCFDAWAADKEWWT